MIKILKSYILVFTLLLAGRGLFGQTRYVTPTGAGTHDGTSEANAWNMSEAIQNATGGMTIYVKQGLYSSFTWKNSGGSISSRIKLIGYDNTPGDIVASQGTTFDTNTNIVSSALMPTIDGNGSGNGIVINGDYVDIANFQITEVAWTGVNNNGYTNEMDNIAVVLAGDLTANVYSGKGFELNGSNQKLTNSYVYNAGAEGISVRGGWGCEIDYCYAKSDNTTNPMDYYILITLGSQFTTVTNSTVERANGLFHGGHGLTMKDLAENNTYRNCTAIGTGVEANFSGVKNNLYENIEVYNYGTDSGQWQATVSIGNGANNNTYRNIYIHDTWAAISGFDTDDGYVGPGGDRDLVAIGDGNVFENIVIHNVDRVFTTSAGGGGTSNAPADNWVFRNVTVHQTNRLFVTSAPLDGWQFYNFGVKDKTSTASWFSTNAPNGATVSFLGSNCRYNNSNGSWPAYFTSSGDPDFVNEGGSSAADYDIGASSAWINMGTSVNGTATDYDGTSANGQRDVGAFEYDGSPAGDTTAPSVVSVTTSSITDNSFTSTIELNEAASARIYFGTTSHPSSTEATVSADYSNATIFEPSYLFVHQQSPSASNPGPDTPLESGTVYYYRWRFTDAAGNSDVSAEQTVITLNTGEEPQWMPLGSGVKGREMLKKVKQ